MSNPLKKFKADKTSNLLIMAKIQFEAVKFEADNVYRK